MKAHIKISVVIAFLVLSLTGPIQGQIITFNFTGTNPGQNGPWTTTSFLATNVTLNSGFALGSGVAGNSGNNRFNANAWDQTSTEGNAITGNDYIGFAIQASSGYQLNLNGASITFTLQNSGTGPDFAGLYTSVGGFSSGNAINYPTLNTAGATSNFSINMPGSGYNNLTGSLEFRIYGWGASSAAGTMSANAFSIAGGTVTAIPEPSTYALLALGLGGIALLRRRVRPAV